METLVVSSVINPACVLFGAHFRLLAASMPSESYSLHKCFLFLLQSKCLLLLTSYGVSIGIQSDGPPILVTP